MKANVKGSTLKSCLPNITFVVKNAGAKNRMMYAMIVIWREGKIGS